MNRCITKHRVVSSFFIKKTCTFQFKTILFQLFSCGTVIINVFMYGMYAGAPTVIIPQLRKEGNSTDVVSSEQASWFCKYY